jgi:hypothetical protein
VRPDVHLVWAFVPHPITQFKLNSPVVSPVAEADVTAVTFLTQVGLYAILFNHLLIETPRCIREIEHSVSFTGHVDHTPELRPSVGRGVRYDSLPQHAN